MKLCIADGVLSTLRRLRKMAIKKLQSVPRTHYTSTAAQNRTQKKAPAFLLEIPKTNPSHIYGDYSKYIMILEYGHLKEEWNTEKLYFSFKKRIVKKRMALRFRLQKMKKLMAVNWSICVYLQIKKYLEVKIWKISQLKSWR